MKLKAVSRIKTGTAEAVSFEVPPIYRQEYARLIKEIGDGLYTVEIKKYRKLRSTGEYSANHHLNGHCQQIANESGHDFHDVKMYVKMLAIKRGLPLKTNPDGSYVYSLSTGEPMPISEADMDSLQCSWCIEEAHILAGELGIVLQEE
jgi:hypothetical protein